MSITVRYVVQSKYITIYYNSEQGGLLEREIFIKSKNPPLLIVFNNTQQTDSLE